MAAAKRRAARVRQEAAAAAVAERQLAMALDLREDAAEAEAARQRAEQQAAREENRRQAAPAESEAQRAERERKEAGWQEMLKAAKAARGEEEARKKGALAQAAELAAKLAPAPTSPAAGKRSPGQAAGLQPSSSFSSNTM